MIFARALLTLCLIAARPRLLAQKQSTNGPRITFEKSLHDFGCLVEGRPANYAFRFINTGNAPLIIQRCTTSDPHTANWPKDPILPGKHGEIVVSMPTQGRRGRFEKSVRIISNVDAATQDGRCDFAETTIHIKGVVEADSANKGLMHLPSAFVFFDTLQADGVVTKIFRCSNVGKIPVRITGLESTYVYRNEHYEDIFQLRVDDEDLTPGETTTLRLTLDARKATPGELSNLLYLRISNGDGCALHIAGWVKPPRPVLDSR